MKALSVARPYLRTSDEVTRALQVRTDTGLSSVEAARRIKEYGANVLPVRHTSWTMRLIRERFKDPLVLVLVAAAALSIFLKEYSDGIIIAAAILIDGILTFVQLHRAEKALAKIREHTGQIVTVKRDGELQKKAASELAIGDIIEIQAGEKIPADARLLKNQGLAIDESALTGESSDVNKQAIRLETRTPLANQTNMVFMGTINMSGWGEAVVVATGTRTEYGKIAQILRGAGDTPTPLQKKLKKTSLQIGSIIGAAVALLAAIHLAQGKALIDIIKISVTLFVSAIPEDLTMILTIALTVGSVRILQRKGVVRHLASAETLGAATVICVDKTGTLTAGKMTAEKIDLLQGQSILPGQMPTENYPSLALIALALASNAHRVSPNKREYIGVETERTSLAFVEKTKLTQTDIRQTWRLRDSLNFNARWKYRAVLCDHPRQSTQTLFVTGAPEVLLERSSYKLNKKNEREKIKSQDRYSLKQQLETHTKVGKHLLGIAVRPGLQKKSLTHDDIHNLTFLGALIIEDPVRKDVPLAIKECHAAGMKVKIITGDAAATAQWVARAVGLSALPENIREGIQIEDMPDKELKEIVDHVTIFARVTPLDKQRIIQALQARGHVVAMTGDGVNDAIALKTADIGVAMGSGKDITKDVAALILINNNFTTIVAAIREGRVLRDNLRKVISFLLATNVAEVAIFFASILMRLPIPLLPAQILWINLVTDGTSDIALSFEPEERNVMKRRPENPNGPLLSRAYVWQIAISGAITTLIAMGLYLYLYQTVELNLDYIRTMIFTFVAVSSLIAVWSWRSVYETIFRRGIMQNRWIILSAGFSFSLQLLTIYNPFLRSIFRTVPLELRDWGVIFGLSLITLLLIESRKLFFQPETETIAT